MKSKKHLPIQKCLNGSTICSLSDSELLAIIIGSGSRNQDVMNITANILEKFEGLKGLNHCGIHELSRIDGIGNSKAIKILAALELGKKILQTQSNDIIINSPYKVWKFLLPELHGNIQEKLILLLLNTKNIIIKKKILAIGSISGAICKPREVFRDAIREAASSIIIAHNHPSGINDPSEEDIKFTDKINNAGKIIGIKLSDHVIISDTSYYSFKEANLL